MNADQFRHEMRQLPEPVTDKKPPYWEAWRHQLWQHVTKGDDPKNFLGWPCIFHTMCQAHWPDSIRYELKELITGSLEDYDYWIQAVTMPHFYHSSDFQPGTDFSMNQIHQCYHLKQWQEFTGWKVAGLDRIVEFGGGYGAMALACHRLGFRGEYIIYDLPEFRLLQQYYLSQMGVPVTHWDSIPEPIRESRLDMVKADLIIGIYSLSECETDLRYEFLKSTFADSYLFLYSGKWEEYDNVDFFQKIFPEFILHKWQHTELTHLPDRYNFYSVGVWE